jgi:hypothetical protein
LRGHAIELLECVIHDAHLRASKYLGRPKSADKRRGPDRKAFMRRDTLILLALAMLVRNYPLSITRNAATPDQESACSIVSKALARFEVTLSEARIAEIFAAVRKATSAEDVLEIYGVPFG